VHLKEFKRVSQSTSNLTLTYLKKTH